MRECTISIRIIMALCLSSLLVHDGQAIFNCFSMGNKKGIGQNPYGMYPGSGTNWPSYGTTGYAQSATPQMGLFGNKWAGGAGASYDGTMKPSFPMAKSWNNWKLGSTGFYRPGLGYGGYSGGYGGSNPTGTLPTMPTFAPPGGWSVPLSNPAVSYGHSYGNMNIEQKQLSTRTPTASVIQGTVDPYKPLLSNPWQPDNNYDAFHSNTPGPSKGGYGYSYPDWYSGTAESPARIAQRLVKLGIKGARKSPDTSAKIKAQPIEFGLQAEPRFKGFGSVQTVSSREVRLNCAFGESIDPNNKPIWSKFIGSYNTTQVTDGKVKPPFNCDSSECRTVDINADRSHRYKIDDGPATTTLIIYDPRSSDIGAYRCSALSRSTAPQIPIETLYQVVLFSG